jgi:hypothetical protein
MNVRKEKKRTRTHTYTHTEKTPSNPGQATTKTKGTIFFTAHPKKQKELSSARRGGG